MGIGDSGSRDGGEAADAARGGDATPHADAAPPGALLAGDVRLVYGDMGLFQLSSQRWRGSDRVWEAASQGGFETGTMRWTVNAARASGVTTEIVASLGDSPGGDDTLRVFRLDGGDWILDWSEDVPPSDKRGVDVAFEASGDAMVVYADGSNTPKYRVRIGDTWGAEAVVPVPLAGGCPAKPGCVVQWVELTAMPGTDRIALGFADSERNLTVMIWSGDQWLTTTIAVHETNLKANRVSTEVHNRAFDLAFEHSSGGLMVLWGRNGSGMVWYTRLDPIVNVWSPVASIDVIAGEAHFVDLATQPGEDRIAAGVFDLGDGTERLGAATWTGSAWVDVGELDGQTRNVNDEALSDWPGGVAWVGDTGQAVLVYSDNKAAELHWARWGGSRGWALEAPVAIAGKKLSESLHLVGSSSGAVVAAFTDEDGALYAASYNGVAWTVAGGGAPVAPGTATTASTPFSLAAARD